MDGGHFFYEETPHNTGMNCDENIKINDQKSSMTGFADK